eukprot:746654-Hanusia_phi.AAC.4
MAAQSSQLPPLEESIVVSLNVGGVKFDTTAGTLLKGARQGSKNSPCAAGTSTVQCACVAREHLVG